jgi:hypothetical protein
VLEQFGEQLPGVEVVNGRALRHGHLDVVAPATMQVLALAVGAPRRPPVRMITESEQGRHVVVGDEPHVAALTAIAPIRPAADDRTFPTEAHRARAAVSAAHVELALVDELGHRIHAIGGASRGPVTPLL